jgi:tRNA nucleotidyltransferase (CCA-adding enzyme)
MATTPDQFVASLGFVGRSFRVGGSVRDELIDRRSKDSDYVIQAPLDYIEEALLKNGAKVSKLQLRGGGVQIGWRAAVHGIGVLEIAVPRTEHSTGPGRHDFEITVDPDLALREDAVRRDFAMNALYCDVHTQRITDPLGTGLNDIHNKVIGTTHADSFRDDPLRILRALRFVSKLNFNLHSATYTQMEEHASAVTGLTQKGVSGTAFDELCGILMGSFPGKALREMESSGVMAVFLPELAEMLGFEQRSRYHEKTTSEHTFDAVQAAAQMHGHAPLRVRMALLFHDCGKPKGAWVGKDGLQHYYALDPKTAVELGASVNALVSHEEWSQKLWLRAGNRLNVPNQLRHDVSTLIIRHMLTLHENVKPFKIRKLRMEIGDDLLRDLITHRACDVIGKGGDISEAMEVLEWIANEQKRAIELKVPTSVKDLAINGRDLLDMDISGRAIGAVLKQLLLEVVAQPKLNTPEWLLARADRIRP